MTRQPGYIAPTDTHRVIKLPPETFEKLGREASLRAMSRPKLALELLDFMLDNPEIIEELLDQA